MIGCCLKFYDINLCQEKLLNARVAGSEHRKADDSEVPNVDQNKWVKTMENIALHLKLMMWVKGTLLAHVVQHYIKVAHILL